MYILRLYKGYATTIKLNNTKRRAYAHEPPVSPKNGTRLLYIMPCMLVPAIFMQPKRIANMSDMIKRKRGLTPNDSKKCTRHFIFFISTKKISVAKTIDAKPHVTMAKVGDQIFLLMGQA